MDMENKDLIPEEEGREREVDGFTSDDVALNAVDNTDMLEELAEDTAADGTPKKPKKRRRPLFDSRRFRTGTLASVVTVVAVAAIVLFNVVVGLVESRWPLNIDTTALGIYTLSDEAAEIAKGIDKEITLVVCADEKLLTEPNTGLSAFDNMLRQLHATINHFQNLSGGKVKVEYVDLNANPVDGAKYTEMGATAGSLVYVCGDNNRVTTILEDYTDMPFEEAAYYQYYGQTPTVNSVVENTLAININAVSGKDLPIVTFVTGHGSNNDVATVLEDRLKKSGYIVERVDITTSAVFSEKSQFAVVLAPTEDYNDVEIKKLRDWVANEKKYDRHLMVLTPDVANTPNLNTFVEDTFGVIITRGLAWQTDQNYVYSGASTGMYNYYSYADTAASEFSKEGKRVLAPFCRILQAAQGVKQTLTPLFTFPETTQIFNIEEYEADKENYKPVDGEDYPLVGGMLSLREHDSGAKTYGVVFGATDFVHAMTAFSENEEMILATVSGVLDNDDALSLPGKTLSTDNVFMVDTQATATALFIVFVIIVPVATLAICLVVFLKRRHL